MPLGALVASALALAVAPTAGAGPFHGVVAAGELPADDYRRMAAGNVGTLRMTVSWRNVEPTPGERRWAWLDGRVTAAAEHGVRVLPVLTGPSPSGLPTPPTSQAGRRAYAEFAGDMAERYGRNGLLWESGVEALPIKSWQIYNEQNGRVNWGVKPNPRRYARLLKGASKAIAREDRAAEIVLGGMFGTPSGAGSLKSWNYLKRLYAVRGIKGAFDTLAIHPYSPNIYGVRYQIRKLRGVMRANRDRRAKLRITELGWGSQRKGHNPLAKGRRGQARMLKRAFRLLEQKRRAWEIKGVNWYQWKDNPEAPCLFCRKAGLLSQGGDPKPSWPAFKRIAR